MNDQQHAFWLAYIRQLADLLGLKDWRIDLDRDPSTRDTAGASNFTFYGRKAADITFGPSFLTKSPDDQRWIIAHECLHCHFDRMHKGVQDYAESKGDDSDSYFAQSHLRDFEAVVDTMAVIVAPFLPLPGEENRRFDIRDYAELGETLKYPNDSEMEPATVNGA